MRKTLIQVRPVEHAGAMGGTSRSWGVYALVTDGHFLLSDTLLSEWRSETRARQVADSTRTPEQRAAHRTTLAQRMAAYGVD